MMKEKSAKNIITGPSKRMLKRMLIIMLAMVIGTTSVIGVRLAQIMIFQGEKYRTLASEQQLYDTTISAPRGDIYDCNMNLLATSSTAWNVYITPNSLKKIDKVDELQKVKNAIADGLAPILGVERETIYGYTEKTSSYYIVIKKRIDKNTADAVREFLALKENKQLKLTNYIGLDETTKRYYPNGNLASVVLGFVGSDNQGLAGLESYYDTTLTGIAGRVIAAKNAKGTDMPFTYQKIVDATAGNSLVTSIDTYVQHVTEKYLDRAVKDNGAAERGAAIVMNVNTGEILAMAIKGDFDPNAPFTLSESDQAIVDALEGDKKSEKLAELRNRQWRNKAVSDTYEPGSVFKIMTLCAALEENITSEKMTFTCPGYITVAGQRYSCSHKNGHGTQNLLQATANSCNPAFISLGNLLGANKFSKYFESFGLTSKTGIDLPGESTSMYHLEKNMGPTELSSSAFGQTFQTTPIQMITAMAAAVNGGKLVQPHIVKQIQDHEGNVVKTIGTTVKRQVISKKTSELVCKMMESVVDGGTARNAKIAGYRLGGKTGTSQKVAKILATGNKRLYIASFCGVAPMQNPEIAILVMIDEPTGDSYYGGTVSAPVAAQIFEDILPYIGQEPKYSAEELESIAVSVPNCVSKSVAAAKTAITNSKLTYKIIGEGETVISQMPAATDSVNTGGVVVLYTESLEDQMTNVPNFIGMTAKQVSTAAAAANVNVDFSGTAPTDVSVKAYKQSIQGGETVKQGTIITVNFRDSNTND